MSNKYYKSKVPNDMGAILLTPNDYNLIDDWLVVVPSSKCGWQETDLGCTPTCFLRRHKKDKRCTKENCPKMLQE